MRAPASTVAHYLDHHEGWFRRCAAPMQVEALGRNGYVLTLGRFGNFGFEVEPTIGLELMPQSRGVYRICTVPPEQFERWCVQPTKKLVAAVRSKKPGTKFIGFPRGAQGSALWYATETGVDGIGCDTAMPPYMMSEAFEDEKIVVQGNLDPLLLVVGGDAMDERVHEILDLMPRFFAGESVEHHSANFDFNRVAFVREPIRIPILMGGASKPALRRAARTPTNHWRSPPLPISARRCASYSLTASGSPSPARAMTSGSIWWTSSSS